MGLLGVEAKQTTHSPLSHKSELKSTFLRKFFVENAKPSSIITNRRRLRYFYIISIFSMAIAVGAMGLIFILKIFMLP